MRKIYFKNHIDINITVYYNYGIACRGIIRCEGVLIRINTMNDRKQRVTKIRLEEIPRINTFGRNVLADLFIEGAKYEEINKKEMYFTKEELHAIEQQYSQGILLKEVFEALEKKKWRINPNTMKHYIQIGQLPKSIESKKGIPARYPANFIRHLNIIRFLLESRREGFEEVLSVLRKIGATDRELLQQHDQSYDEWDMDFIQMFYSGINTRLWDGVSNGEEAVKKAFANDHKKQEEYLKRLEKIANLIEKLENEVKDLEKECEIRRLSNEDK